MMLPDSRASVVTSARPKFDIVSILLGANAFRRLYGFRNPVPSCGKVLRDPHR